MPKRRSQSADEIRSLRERNELLESLSDVGVALAGSFDIQAILAIAHDAASRLSGRNGVDVLYFGSETINSRPLWYPSDPGESNIEAERRRRLHELLTSPSRDRFSEESISSEVEDRLCLPIRYQDDQLGFLFVEASGRAYPDLTRLLSILTLQAATALRNIHLTQERIQFERLSAIGRMIGTVVHDFRSPLTALRGFAGMLTNLKLDERERSAYGRHLIEECDRLNHMVGELLELTRGGAVELDLAPVRLGAHLQAFAGRLRAHYGTRGIRIELDLGFADVIDLDRERIDRALWNVATNACQAMPEGGTLWIRTRPHHDGVQLSIEDEGTGIPEEVRHRIFEPFFSYGKSEGIGLGMLIARKIAEEHGGVIEVESEPGMGTRVRFELPLRDAQNATPVEAGKISNVQ